MGVPFERRGARFDDYVQAMRKVWKGDVVDHESDFIQWKGFQSYPIPKNLPLIIGGSKGKAFTRTAQFGDGYFAPGNGVDTVKSLLDKLSAACEEIGRDRGEIEVTGMWLGLAEGVDSIKQYEDIGVDRLVILLPALGGKPEDALDKLGDEVISKQ